MNSPRLLVVICTHNPHPTRIQRALDALRDQSVPVATWDLLVIDNASSPPLAGSLRLDWHPAHLILREEKLGTAHARHAALRHAHSTRSELLLFVDDDNVLKLDYLARGLELAGSRPRLGCWGGQLQPLYETQAPGWAHRYFNYLAIWEFSRETCVDHFDGYDSLPPTAGCFIRGAVVSRYLELVSADPRRLQLGACGDVQLRGEDTDLVLTAFDLGLQVGRFPELCLTHLIPAGRLTPDYIAGLMNGTLLGTAMLEYIRYGRIPAAPTKNWLQRLIESVRIARLPRDMRLIANAERRARRDSRRLVRDWQNG